MFRLKKMLSLLVIAALLAACVGAAAETQGFRLPSALTIVEEEAFLGGGATHVIVPEGVEEIHARAFANSGLKEIDLPASVKFIAENAFDGSALTLVNAAEGTYAYDWAVAHGYIGTSYTPMQAQIVSDAAAVNVGDRVAWTVNASGGQGAYQFAFQLYRDDSLVIDGALGESNHFEYVADQAGSYHATCRIVDRQAEISVSSGKVQATSAPLTAAISCDADEANTGDSLTWTVRASGGAGVFTYTYVLYRGTKKVKTVSDSSENRYTYSATTAGTYHVVCTVSDGINTKEVTSDKVKVTELKQGLTISGLDVSSDRFQTTDTQTWTISADGGTSPYYYSFKLIRGSRTLQSQDFSGNRQFSYTFFQAGDYTLSVSVRDKNRDTVTEERTFTVELGPTEITGVVRVYVDTDSSGKILRSTKNTGHFELELDNYGGNSIVFDNKVFDNPVFSYGSTNGGAIKVFDGSEVDRSSAKLYTFTFETTADKVDELLNSEMGSKYLQLGTDSSISIGYMYDAQSTYKYVISSRNCFTTVAAWCSLLGYGKLSSIVSSANGDYTKYIAWKMYESYGDYWDYVMDT